MVGGIKGVLNLHIYIHDYAGHPFQADLSRELALRGWRVTHAFFEGDPGPKGALTKQADDPATLSFRPLGIHRPYSKEKLLQRRQGDLVYGRRLADDVRACWPDLVLSGNTPLEAQERLRLACEEAGIPLVFWCQDIYSIAATRILGDKLGAAGRAIGRYYASLERRQMRRAAQVIHISNGFQKTTSEWGVPDDKVSVIPNWATIEDLPLCQRTNDWSERHGFGQRHRVLYTGTLGLKHDPDALNHLAATLDIDLGVIASGSGVSQLFLNGNLHALPLQPIEELAEVMGTADVLVATIEQDAGAFSVPSKILSYLCAGRPIVLAAPKENLAAQILLECGAGMVVEPGDHGAFRDAVASYLSDPGRARVAGLAGRSYAEAHFRISDITDRFEAVFSRALGDRMSAVA